MDNPYLEAINLTETELRAWDASLAREEQSIKVTREAIARVLGELVCGNQT